VCLDHKSMNKSLRAILSLSWQSLAYGVGILGSQLIVYILLPFLTRYMPREEYGVISVITALYAFVNVLTNAGLMPATFRYFNKNEDDKDRRATLGASQFLFFLFAFVPAVGIMFFSKPISMFLLGSEQYALVLQVVAGYLVVDSMNSFGAIVLRIEVRPLISSIHSIILIACQIGFALLLVVHFDIGIFGYWLGQLIGEILGLALMIWLIRKKITFQISWQRVIQLAKFGVPLIPATLSMTALRVADRYIIGSLVGLEQVAIYDVGYKIGSIISLVISPFRTAWNPFAFSIAQNPEAPRVYKDVLTYLVAGCSFLILGVIAFRSQLVQFIAPASYGSAVKVVGWVAASQLFLAAYFVLSMGPMIANQTHRLVWIAVFAGGVNVFLNFALIPIMGITGAAVATFAGYVLLAILAYFIGKRSFDLKIDWLRMSRLALVIGLVGLIILTAEQLIITGWVEIVVKVLGLVSFPILLLLTRFVNPTQVGQLLTVGRNLMDKKTRASGSDLDSSL
jgi:O-antigen/teichoic acid export membrane protein